MLRLCIQPNYINKMVAGLSCWAYCWYYSLISRWTFL